MPRTIAVLALFAVISALSACAIYEPGYAYDGDPYGPSYAYAPPAYGSFDLFFGEDFGWHGGHGHGGWGHGGWGHGHGWH